jgi:hypothetical protein
LPPFTFNIAKGRAAELANRVNNNDPANAVLALVALVSTATDATLKDYDTLAAIIADGNTAEATNAGYSRIVLDNTDSIVVTVDDAGDIQFVDFPDQVFPSVAAGDDWTHLVVCYDADSTGGTDSAIVPLTCSPFVVSPNGGDVGVTVAAGGAFVAGE